MEKEFIPYEQALALKELGFDEKCFAIHSFVDGELNFMYVNNFHSNDDVNELSAAAPLYQQAFRWFREKYGLRIRNYGSINYSGGLSEYFEIFKYGYGTSNKSLSIEIGALTYEEAELACLEKLIDVISM